jgi:hydroxymethylglutaryl-CoA lyase
VCVADTIGVASPGRVRTLLEAVKMVTDLPLRCHFHNTRNTGYANAYAAIAAGVTALDASAGGIGGCPFAPEATGNIATEDLLWSLHRDGVATGVDVPGVLKAANLIEGALGGPLPAQLGRVSDFPPA